MKPLMSRTFFYIYLYLAVSLPHLGHSLQCPDLLSKSVTAEQSSSLISTARQYIHRLTLVRKVKATSFKTPDELAAFALKRASILGLNIEAGAKNEEIFVISKHAPKHQVTELLKELQRKHRLTIYRNNNQEASLFVERKTDRSVITLNDTFFLDSKAAYEALLNLQKQLKYIRDLELLGINVRPDWTLESTHLKTALTRTVSDMNEFGVSLSIDPSKFDTPKRKLFKGFVQEGDTETIYINPFVELTSLSLRLLINHERQHIVTNRPYELEDHLYMSGRKLWFVSKHGHPLKKVGYPDGFRADELESRLTEYSLLLSIGTNELLKQKRKEIKSFLNFQKRWLHYALEDPAVIQNSLYVFLEGTTTVTVQSDRLNTIEIKFSRNPSKEDIKNILEARLELLRIYRNRLNL